MEERAVGGRLRSVLPVFLVEDVVASAEYYRDVLRLRIALLFPDDEPVLAIVDRSPGEGFHLAYGAGFPPRKNRDVDPKALDACVEVDDIARVYEELRAAGAQIGRVVEVQPGGVRQFDVEDLNGFALGFVQRAASTSSPYKVCPQFLVADAASAAQSYRTALGFRGDTYQRGGGTEARLHRDGVTVYLRSSRPPRTGRSNRGEAHEVEGMWDAYVEVDGVRALREEFRRRRAGIVRDVAVTDYGTAEVEVQDEDGYVLCFGEILPA